MVVSERETLSATHVKKHIAINVLNKGAFGAFDIGEGKDAARFLVGIHIRGRVEGLIPLAREPDS